MDGERERRLGRGSDTAAELRGCLSLSVHLVLHSALDVLLTRRPGCRRAQPTASEGEKQLVCARRGGEGGGRSGEGVPA